MARVEVPKWKKEFNQRMKAQLKLFGKLKECPSHLTKWEYKNGRVAIEDELVYPMAWGRRSRWGRRTGKKIYKWIPGETKAPEPKKAARPNEVYGADKRPLETWAEYYRRQVEEKRAGQRA